VTDEPQRFITGASKRIMAHANRNVRNQAYEVLSLSPFLPGPRDVATFNERIRESLSGGKSDNFHDRFVITPSIYTIDYTYSVLEEWEGVWIFELARFFEKLSFSFSPPLNMSTRQPRWEDCRQPSLPAGACSI
jgi:hypothetical protein